MVRVKKRRLVRRLPPMQRKIIEIRVQSAQAELKSAQLNPSARAICDCLDNVRASPAFRSASVEDYCEENCDGHNQQEQSPQNPDCPTLHPPPPEGWTTIFKRAFASSSHCDAF